MMSDALSRAPRPGHRPDVVAAYARSPSALRRRLRLRGRGRHRRHRDDRFRPRPGPIIEIAAAIVRGPEVVERFTTLVDPAADSGRDHPSSPESRRDGRRSAHAPKLRSLVSSSSSAPGHRRPQRRLRRAFLARVGGAARSAALDRQPAARRASRLPRLALTGCATSPTRSVRASPRTARRMTSRRSAYVWRVMLWALGAPPGVLHQVAARPRRGVGAADRARAPRGCAAPGGVRSQAAPPFARRGATAPTARRRRRDRVHLPDRRRVWSEFPAEGLAARMYAGYEERVEQDAMAEADLEAFGTRTHLASKRGPAWASRSRTWCLRRSSQSTTGSGSAWRPRRTRSPTSWSTTSCPS